MDVDESNIAKNQVSWSVDDRWNLVCDFCESVLNIPVLKSRRGTTPQMNKAFASVDLINVEGFSRDMKEYIDTGDDLVQRVKGRCIMFFKIQCYGTGAVSALQLLRVSFTTDIFKMFEGVNYFGLSSIGEVNNISSLFLDSAYEERAELEFSLYTYIPYQFVVDWYNRFKLSMFTNGRIEYETYIKGEQDENME